MSIDWKDTTEKMIAYMIEDDVQAAVDLASDCLNNDATPTDFFSLCITPALQEMGRRFDELEIFLPQMIVAADLVQTVTNDVVNPAIENSVRAKAAQPEKRGKVLMATVQGDIHDIGKSMVSLMLRVSGFEVIDLGTNVPPMSIIENAEKEKVDIIGMSTLLTTCLPYIQDTMTYLDGKKIRDKYAVIIGGAAPTPEFARLAGVDAFGHTAAEAVRICEDLMSKRVK